MAIGSSSAPDVLLSEPSMLHAYLTTLKLGPLPRLSLCVQIAEVSKWYV
jgi:hypothetical protein